MHEGLRVYSLAASAAEKARLRTGDVAAALRRDFLELGTARRRQNLCETSTEFLTWRLMCAVGLTCPRSQVALTRAEQVLNSLYMFIGYLDL